MREPGSQKKNRTVSAKWLISAGVVMALAMAAWYFPVQELFTRLLRWIDGLGWWGPAFFIASYVVATVLLIPGSALTLGAGAVFGFGWALLWVSAGSTLGATAAFLVGRYFAREWVAKKVQGNERFAAIDCAISREGWKIVGLTRLSPLFPFTVLNYAFSLTSIKLRDYVLASWLGMMPGMFLYVYLGSLAQIRAGRHERTPAEWALYGIGLVATLGVTILVTRLARRELARRTDET